MLSQCWKLSVRLRATATSKLPFAIFEDDGAGRRRRGRAIPAQCQTGRKTKCSYTSCGFICQLSVFFGNFTLDAARSVAKTDGIDDDAVMAALASLVSKSMLTLDTSNIATRYRLLDATRTYAQEKLAASPNAAVIAGRYACYFLDLLQDIEDGPDSTLAQLVDQFGNIRGALNGASPIEATVRSVSL